VLRVDRGTAAIAQHETSARAALLRHAVRVGECEQEADE
jgi:hypothetical protein